MTRTFELAGDTPEKAGRRSEGRSWLSKTAPGPGLHEAEPTAGTRPNAIHMMPLADLEKLTPDFDWQVLSAWH